MSIKQPSCLDVRHSFWQGCSDVSAWSCWCRTHAVRAAVQICMSRPCMAGMAEKTVPLCQMDGRHLGCSRLHCCSEGAVASCILRLEGCDSRAADRAYAERHKSAIQLFLPMHIDLSAT